MPKVQIPFVGGSYKAHSGNLNAQEAINIFPVIDSQQGKSPVSMYRVPGSTEFADLGTGEKVDQMLAWDALLYAVSDGNIFEIDSVGAVTDRGALAGISSSGNTWMEKNRLQIMIADGSVNGWTYTVSTTTAAAIADGDFPGASSLTYQDGYGIVSVPDSDQFNISGLYDFTSWDALHFATAETKSDTISTIFSNGRELRLFGKENLENWFNSGADFPFDLMKGTEQAIGTIAPASVASGDNAVMWLGITNQIWLARGYAPQIISTPQIEHQIEGLGTFSDAIGFTYTQEGNTFYILTFPTGGKTFAYDLSTGFWHQRSTGTQEGRWRANCNAFFGNKNLIGDYADGKIYLLDMDTRLDGGEPIKWLRTAQHISESGFDIFHNSLEVNMDTGFALAGEKPQIWLSWSDDGGKTWSNQHQNTMGKSGQYSKKLIWGGLNGLGKSADRIYKLEGDGAAKTSIIDAYLYFDLGSW